MSKRGVETKRQTTVCTKTRQRKLKSDQHEPHQKNPGLIPCAIEGYINLSYILETEPCICVIR